MAAAAAVVEGSKEGRRNKRLFCLLGSSSSLRSRRYQLPAAGSYQEEGKESGGGRERGTGRGPGAERGEGEGEHDSYKCKWESQYLVTCGQEGHSSAEL